jgi:hypothetical protein
VLLDPYIYFKPFYVFVRRLIESSMLFAVFCLSRTLVLNDRSSHIWACWKGFALERAFRISFGHYGLFETKFNIKCICKAKPRLELKSHIFKFFNIGWSETTNYIFLDFTLFLKGLIIRFLIVTWIQFCLFDIFHWRANLTILYLVILGLSYT